MEPPVEQIRGNERLGWDQAAATAEEVASLTFVIYVDATRIGLQEFSCDTTPGPAGFACSAKLPTMSAGRHELRLAAVSGDGTAVESNKSDPLTVIVTSSTTSVNLPGSSRAVRDLGLAVTTKDRVSLRIDAVVDGLQDPTDIAVLPDGRILVAERMGTIRLVYPDRPQASRLSLALTLDDVDVRRRGGLLAMVPDPRFDRTGFVYVVYTSAAGFRLARFREASGALGERVILLDGVSASKSPSAAALRFGPDAKLYLALDDAGDARRAGDLGSYNGKVLRLNADATTPPDQPGGTPVHVLNVNAPHGLVWGTTGSPLWVAQDGPDPGHTPELRTIVAAPDQPARTRVALRYLLPAGIEPSQMILYQGSLIPAFKGDLLMTGGEGGLLRMKVDASDGLKVISAERLFEDSAETLCAIAAAPDGAIYLATSTRLMKIVPADGQ